MNGRASVGVEPTRRSPSVKTFGQRFAASSLLIGSFGSAMADGWGGGWSEFGELNGLTNVTGFPEINKAVQLQLPLYIF